MLKWFVFCLEKLRFSDKEAGGRGYVGTAYRGLSERDLIPLHV